MAHAFLAAESSLFGPRIRSLRWFKVAFLLSVTGTTVLFVIGDHQDRQYFPSWWRAVTYLPEHQLHLAYPINYLFDTITLALTVVILRKVAKAHPLPGLLLIFLDFVAAAGLAWVALNVIHALEFWPNGSFNSEGVHVEILKLNTQQFFSYWELLGVYSWDWSWVQRLSENTGGWFGPHSAGPYGLCGGWANFLAGITSFGPTGAYLMVFMVLFLSILAFRTARALALQLFALDVETENSVFFYTGTLVGLSVTAVKLIIEIGRFFG